MVLHALRLEVGDDDFFEILRQWVARYTGSSATSDDFRSLAAEIAGRDLERRSSMPGSASPDPPDAIPVEVAVDASSDVGRRAVSDAAASSSAVPQTRLGRSVRASARSAMAAARRPRLTPAQRNGSGSHRRRAMADPRERDEVRARAGDQVGERAAGEVGGRDAVTDVAAGRGEPGGPVERDRTVPVAWHAERTTPVMRDGRAR